MHSLMRDVVDQLLLRKCMKQKSSRYFFVLIHLFLSEKNQKLHVKVLNNPSVSVKNRSLRDSSRMRTRTRTRNGSMDACLSFTIVSNFTDTDTYTDHGHGSQITDLWMASLIE